jgi:ataxin-10
LKIQTKEDQLNWVKVVQLLVPENSSWNNEQLLGLLGWLHESFVLLCPTVINTIGTENHEAMEIAIVLDIIGELCQYHIFKQGLISYKFIKPLIELFGTIQLHIKPANMLKPTTDEGFSYPHVKSTIIEIISYLAHDTPEIQDEVRELHGLNLVLSNCVIDDNNPFIKERAITCLKFLLANNSKNQQVVRELEETTAHEESTDTKGITKD